MNKISTSPGLQSHATIELADLFEAYADCRTNKRNTMNALSFELDYEQELITLWEEINTGTYAPGRSIAFIVDQPVKREIFAADLYLGISMLNRNKGFGKNINNQGARVSGCYFVTSYVGLN